MVKSTPSTVTASETKKLTVLTWTTHPPSWVYVNESANMGAQLTDFTGTELLSDKPINLIRNGVKVQSKNTDISGMVSFADKLTAEGTYTYYLEFPGDAEWEGCDTPTATVTAEPAPPLAPSYERVHFIGTALFNIGIDTLTLKKHAAEMMRNLEKEVGYRVFLKDIKVTNRVLWTDVDFVMDVPYGYEKSPGWLLTTVIAFILVHWKAITLAVLAFLGIVWLFWTTWIEKLKVYYCDQHDPIQSYEGYKAYLAHLAGAHPKKYEAASKEAWWEKLVGMLPFIIGAILIIGAMNLLRGR